MGKERERAHLYNILMFTESGESRNCFQTQANEQHGLRSNNSYNNNNNDNNSNNVQSVHLVEGHYDDGVTVLPSHVAPFSTPHLSWGLYLFQIMLFCFRSIGTS